MNEALLQQSLGNSWLRFNNPLAVIETFNTSDVLPALQEIERLVAEKTWYAVGFVAYEAAPGFDSTFCVRGSDSPRTLPLLSFALYPAPEILPSSRLFPPQPMGRGGTIDTQEAWSPSIDRATYDRAIDTIRAHIMQGNTYQVNYTWRLRKQFTGDPRHWFEEMIRMQCAHHAAYLDWGQFSILSASPELFFSLDGQRLVTKPMKGTATRAPSFATDNLRAKELQASTKNRAENVMIVDMMRNDTSRIAVPGSVRVSRLFALEKYPTVWQMTSTVEATTNSSVSAIFRALFPSASITGAPKINTMKLIANLETTPRGLYTGAIGFIAPGRRAQFNVAIRTAVIDRTTSIAEYGVGGGIVWDSEARSEYAECLAKAQVLWGKRPRFSLLETLLWTPSEQFLLLEGHIERLVASAQYFSYPIDPKQVRDALCKAADQLPSLPHRVRLLLDEDGGIHTESALLEELPREVSLVIAATTIDSTDPFYYHKTTHREGYERARRAALGGEDVLLWNERGEITETTRANVVIELDGERVTPPVSAGLLAGTYRQKLLEQGIIREKTVTLTDLSRRTALWVINSVRGERPATLTRKH